MANISTKKIPHNLSIKDKIRFSNLQAKIVLKHLGFLDMRNEKARNNAHFLSEQLSNIADDIALPVELPETRAVFLLYPIKIRDKWNASFKLLKQGIDTRKKYFGVLCTDLKIFNEVKAPCPVSEKLLQELLYLPVYAELQKDDIIKVVDNIKRISIERR
jgi:dTDP-4-amino-4,6-dideoxygalactose transaminase